MKYNMACSIVENKEFVCSTSTPHVQKYLMHAILSSDEKQKKVHLLFSIPVLFYFCFLPLFFFISKNVLFPHAYLKAFP